MRGVAEAPRRAGEKGRLLLLDAPVDLGEKRSRENFFPATTRLSAAKSQLWQKRRGSRALGFGLVSGCAVDRVAGQELVAVPQRAQRLGVEASAR